MIAQGGPRIFSSGSLWLANCPIGRRGSESWARRGFANFRWTTAGDAVDSNRARVFIFPLLVQRKMAPRRREDRIYWVRKMNMIDWEWPAQLESCQKRIAELKAGIAIQEQKIQRHLDRGTNAEFAQRVLAIKQETLARLHGYKHLIETKIANSIAAQPALAELSTATVE